MEHTFALQSGSNTGSVSSAQKSFRCTACEREFSDAPQRDRHILRCKRRTRSRKRSCLACARAKSRCDQQAPACNRCVLKELTCVYEHVQHQETPSTKHAALASPIPELGSGQVAGFGPEKGHLQLNPVNKQTTWAPVTPRSVEDVQSQESPGNELLSAFLAPQGPPANGEEEQIRPHFVQRRNFQPDDVPGRELTRRASSPPYTILSVSTGPEPPKHNHVAWLPKSHIRLMKQVLKGYVKDVISFDPRPSFLHHVALKNNSLPTPLANAVLVARMYGLKTQATSAFVQDTVRQQFGHILAECEGYNDEEAVAALQAVILYTIMAVLDGDSDQIALPDGNFKKLIFALTPKVWNSCNITTEIVPQQWDDWITLETKRRTLFALHNLDYLIHSQITAPNLMCPLLFDLPLPSAQSIWDASTPESWWIELVRDPSCGVLLQLRDLLAWGEGNRGAKTAHIENWMQSIDKFGMAICSCTMLAVQ